MTPPGDFPCNEFVELVTAYLDGALPADEVRRLEEHLAVCGGCDSVLAQFRMVIALTGRLAEDDVDALDDAHRTPLLTAFSAWSAGRS